MPPKLVDDMTIEEKIQYASYLQALEDIRNGVPSNLYSIQHKEKKENNNNGKQS